ncbi:MAG: N-acetyl-gamma-glutamyl-phosphate reductase [Clostridiales bacterium]|nr:N-acetyl-gamma-glutamyl-phosphate reductase [Clostridiales bacterium]
MPTIFIDGNQGTTGLRIAKRLTKRPDLTLLTLSEENRKSLPHRVNMAQKADVTFLCLPDEASREMVGALMGCPHTVIDASTAHRIEPDFAYGFAELDAAFRKNIQKAARIAVPGCHASGACALLYPLVKERVISPGAPVTLTSLTGYSGGGKAMIAEYECQERDPCLRVPRPYGVGQCHKHLSEIKEICGLTQPPVFNPIVCDFYSGMLVGLPLSLDWFTASGMSAARTRGAIDMLTNLYRDHYAGQPLMTVLPPNPERFLSPIALAGTDGMQLFLTGNDQRMIAYARFDNLGKGASGAAIQCMNLRLGLPETAGLAIA